MSDIDGKDNSPSAFAVFMPMRDDITDEIVTIHPLGELRFDVVASFHPYTFKIDIPRGVHAGSNEVALRN